MKVHFRTPLVLALLVNIGSHLAYGQRTALRGPGAPERIPVILDTDINGDLDDTWALVMLLKSPQFDIKLVTTTSANAVKRARLIAKLLTIAGRTDVPIGLGDRRNTWPKGGSKSAWLKDYQLTAYTGTIYGDGVQALIDTVNRSPKPVTIIAIGPMQTLGAALRKDPGIAAKANLSAMNGNSKVLDRKGVLFRESNTKEAISEAKLVFSAPWKSIAIAPLDTAIVRLGARYRAFVSSTDRLLQAALECSEAFVALKHSE